MSHDYTLIGLVAVTLASAGITLVWLGQLFERWVLRKRSR